MNEPVVWLIKVPDNNSFISHQPSGIIGAESIPLYPFLAELTDEEIQQLAKQFGVVGLHEDAGLYEFARAILRKANEK